MKMLFFCGALAAGEFAASFAPTFADSWPFLALVGVLAALFGHGLGLRGWWLASVFLLGCALFLRAASVEERRFRETPWMRGRERRARQTEPAGVAGSVRRDLCRRMSLGLERERETAGLGRAILLGERSRLPARTKRLFVESGTMHVFAISGLHVVAVADVMKVVLRLLWLPQRLARLATIPLLWGYVLLIGCPPSAMRAVIMATFDGLSCACWRRPDGLRSWALTFSLVQICDPLLIVHVGNALSFAVMLAIVVAGEIGREWPRRRRELLTTCVAWAVGVPISAAVFGRVTPGGLLANLVLIATAKAAVYAGAAGVAVSYASEALARHCNNLCALAIRAMVMVADAVTRVPGTNLETGKWTLLPCLTWYALFALGLLLVKKCSERRRRV